MRKILAAILVISAILLFAHKRQPNRSGPMQLADSGAAGTDASKTESTPTQLGPTEAVAPAVTPVPSVPPNPALIEKVQKEISVGALEDIKSCVDRYDHCHIPNTNPYAVFDGVVNQIVGRLKAARSDFEKLSASDRAQAQEALADATRWALDFPDDNVREQGLFLAELSLSPEERVPKIIASLNQSVSGPLFEEGLAILKRSENGSPDQQTEDFLISNLSNGGVEAGEAIACHSLDFITRANRERFAETLREVSPESKIHYCLSANLKEFDRLKSGG